MAKKVKKATPKKKPVAKKTTRVSSKKKSPILDINADGIVDEKDVELVKKAVKKTTPKKSSASTESVRKFENKIRKLGVRYNDVSHIATEHLGKCKVVWDKNKSKLFHIELESGEKLPKKGLYSL